MLVLEHVTKCMPCFCELFTSVQMDDDVIIGHQLASNVGGIVFTSITQIIDLCLKWCQHQAQPTPTTSGPSSLYWHEFLASLLWMSVSSRTRQIFLIVEC